MIFVYFVYGLAFWGTGLLLGFQARLPVRVLSRPSLVYLSLFATTHGLSEWARVLPLSSPGAGAWRSVSLALMVVSFVLLMHFALGVLGALGRVPKWMSALPSALALIALVAGGVIARAHGVNLASVDAAARYALGLPATLLAAFAFLAVERARHKANIDRIGRRLAFAGGAFVVYAILAGVVVPRAPFFPASWFNADVFFAATGVRVEIARATCAVLATVFLSEAFVVETAKEHAEWERRREEFIAVVAHDLRSPIAAIGLGAAELERELFARTKLDVDRSHKLLRHMSSSLKNLDRMVGDLLDASRIEAHNLALELGSVELRLLVLDVVDRAAATTGRHPVKTVLPESLPTVRADAARLEQVLVNLLSNAARYSAPASEIRVEALARDAEVEISVTNDGDGLAPAEWERLFTRFYRGPSHGRQEGLGLGLYIAKGLVEALGGHIWVESERGKYATFRFTLPRSGAAA